MENDKALLPTAKLYLRKVITFIFLQVGHIIFYHIVAGIGDIE